jgi:predicted kinase
MSETPRTDKAIFVAEYGGPVVVDADFARELEKELAEALAKLRKLRKKINEKKENEKL